MCLRRCALLVKRTGEYVSVMNGKVMSETTKELIMVTYPIQRQPRELWTITDPIYISSVSEMGLAD